MQQNTQVKFNFEINRSYLYDLHEQNKTNTYTLGCNTVQTITIPRKLNVLGSCAITMTSVISIYTAISLRPKNWFRAQKNKLCH